jgi:hypothetical protein
MSASAAAPPAATARIEKSREQGTGIRQQFVSCGASGFNLEIVLDNWHS